MGQLRVGLGETARICENLLTHHFSSHIVSSCQLHCLLALLIVTPTLLELTLANLTSTLSSRQIEILIIYF